MEIRYLNEDCRKISKSDDLEFGKELIPLSAPDNLLANNSGLNETGFGLFAIKDNSTILSLERSIENFIIEQLSFYQVVPSHFKLNEYHQFLENQENHYKISTWALDYCILGDAFYQIRDQVEKLMDMKLKLKKINHMGKEGDYLGFRIIRPQKNDHNPFHRDAWIPYWRNTVNIWLPICGFEEGNGLQLIPESHLWPDDQILKTKAGAEIDGKKYHVAAAIGTVNKFTIETPVLKRGEGLIFSPYLIHGNGVNKKNDVTRVSLEFRFCRDN